MSSGLKSLPIIKGHDFTREEKDFAQKNSSLLMISPCMSRLCNLHCPFCYANSGTNAKSENQLKFKEYKKVIEEAEELGAKTVRIAGWGEPLCDKNFYDAKTNTFPLIDYANSIGLYVVFFTNGTLITREVANNLIHKKVSVISKCNSFEKDVQEWMSGKRGAFKLIQSGLKFLIEVGFNKCNPPRFGVESIICRRNYKELPDLYIWLREHNIIPYFELIMHGGRGKDERFHVSKDEAKLLFEKFLEIDEKMFGYYWFPAPPYVGFPCDKLFYNLVVSDIGDTYPCYGIEINMGNIREKSLKEILRNQQLRKIRNIMDEMHGNCSKCIHHDKCFFGCRCDAFQHGDVFGDYFECWH